MCPSCGKDVHVGSAGPAGLAQHEGKGPCRKSQAKNEQKRQARTLFDVGLKRAKDIPASMPAAAGLSTRNKAPPPVVVIQKAYQGMEAHHTSSSMVPGQVCRGCERGWELMTELKNAEDRMDATISLGKEGDEISLFGIEKAKGQCMGVDKDEIWEIVNPELDRFLGFGKSASEIQSLIRRGNMGVTGFREYLTYLVEEGGVAGVMLDGKVERLIDAINEMYIFRVATILQCKKLSIIYWNRTPHKDSLTLQRLGEQGSKTNLVNVDSDLMPQMTTSSQLVVVENHSAMPVDSRHPCPGIRLELPAGVSPYSTYPFKLHDIFSLPWDIHVLNNQMWHHFWPDIAVFGGSRGGGGVRQTLRKKIDPVLFFESWGPLASTTLAI